jgi:hypothetical protein
MRPPHPRRSYCHRRPDMLTTDARGQLYAPGQTPALKNTSQVRTMFSATGALEMRINRLRPVLSSTKRLWHRQNSSGSIPSRPAARLATACRSPLCAQALRLPAGSCMVRWCGALVTRAHYWTAVQMSRRWIFKRKQIFESVSKVVTAIPTLRSNATRTSP